MLTRPLPERVSARFGLAALTGAAGVLCFAPFGLFWLAPLVWGMLFILLRRAKTPRTAALTGFAFGLAFFLCGVSWVYVSLSVFGGMPGWLAAAATLLFCAVLGLYPALAGALFKRWQPDGLLRQALFFAALLAGADWLRGWLFTGFPWLSIGYSQSPPSPLAGFAPIVGVYGLSLLVALSGALIARPRIGLTCLLLLAAAGHGLRQIEWSQPEGAPLTVALIQGNIPQDMKFRPEAFARTLDLYRDLVAQHPAHLTLLPETALPAFIDQVPPDYLDDLRQLARRQQGDLLLGAVTGDAAQYFNSAISLGNSPQQTYSKHHLVPFGELIPPGFAWFMAYARIPMSSFTRGNEAPPPLLLAGRSLAVNICYEDVFGSEIVRALPAAGLLVNLSNTAWFGDSLAQPQHLQIARMRAAETARPMLRATNTGMTAIIDPQGGLSAVLPPFTTGVLRGEIRAYQGSTPYIRHADWPVLLLVAILLLTCRGRRFTAPD